MTKGQEVSLWAGVAAFFGSVLAVGAFDLLGVDGGWVEFLLALLVAVFTGGAVYSKERLGFAKQRANGDPPPPNPRRKTMTETPTAPAPTPAPPAPPEPDDDDPDSD